ncbi:hypothetical protein B0H10DRAFT_2003417 [Mycena sp. CBHHK59/15]|nr:hypothetical protein B0H10DRAFT_2003417 [Mycena sp. CBHHK59/15]
MREKPGGAATGPLFAIARKFAEVRPKARAGWSCALSTSASPATSFEVLASSRSVCL